MAVLIVSVCNRVVCPTCGMFCFALERAGHEITKKVSHPPPAEAGGLSTPSAASRRNFCSTAQV